ncbi:MAG: hypothetical protein R2839_11265 [Thermomicrobiales bacterium]
MIDTKWAVCPYCGVNQSDRATIIREQLPPAEERFIERGQGVFAPLQPPPSTITAAASQLDFGAEEEFIGPVFASPGIEAGVQLFPDPMQEEETGATEPIRLFDRRRTRALKAADEAAELATDPDPDVESPEPVAASVEAAGKADDASAASSSTANVF